MNTQFKFQRYELFINISVKIKLRQFNIQLNKINRTVLLGRGFAKLYRIYEGLKG